MEGFEFLPEVFVNQMNGQYQEKNIQNLSFFKVNIVQDIHFINHDNLIRKIYKPFNGTTFV